MMVAEPTHLRPLLRALVEAIVAADVGVTVDPRTVLVVAGAARLDARASIRPLGFGGEPLASTSPDGTFERPRITIDGVAQRYEICLRPHFFRTLDARGRLGCVVHELWHLGARRDGTLDPTRSHRGAAGRWEPEVARLVDGLAAQATFAPLIHALGSGSRVRVDAWLQRPPTRIPRTHGLRRAWDERDLFVDEVRWRAHGEPPLDPPRDAATRC
jgi:hypothetical protein